MDYSELIERADELPPGSPELGELMLKIERARLGLRAGREVAVRERTARERGRADPRIDAGPWTAASDPVVAQLETLISGRRYREAMDLARRSIEEDERMRSGARPTDRCHALVALHAQALRGRAS